MKGRPNTIVRHRARRNPSLLVPGLVLFGGVAAAGALYWWNRAQTASGDAPGRVTSSDVVPAGVPGVWMKRGVLLNDTLRNFAQQIRSAVDFDITITSGQRTPAEQAILMLDGTADIASLYRGAAGAEVAAVAAQGVGAAQRVIESQVARGVFVSRHLRGDALDFRVSGLTDSQRDALEWALAASGVEVLDEGDHIHVEEIGSYLATASKVARKTLPVVIALSAGVAVIGIVWIWTKK